MFASATLSSSNHVSSSSYSSLLLLLHIVLAQVSMLLPNKMYCALSLSGEPAAAAWWHWCWWRVGGRSTHFVRIVSGFGLLPPSSRAATLPGPLYAVPGVSLNAASPRPGGSPLLDDVGKGAGSMEPPEPARWWCSVQPWVDPVAAYRQAAPRVREAVPASFGIASERRATIDAASERRVK